MTKHRTVTNILGAETQVDQPVDEPKTPGQKAVETKRRNKAGGAMPRQRASRQIKEFEAKLRAHLAVAAEELATRQNLVMLARQEAQAIVAAALHGEAVALAAVEAAQLMLDMLLNKEVPGA